MPVYTNGAGRWNCFSSGSSSTCASRPFFGTSENAVRTQIWIAISIYVLVAIAKKRLGLNASLFQILQVVSVTLFEKTPILRAFQHADSEDELDPHANQLNLFNL